MRLKFDCRRFIDRRVDKHDWAEDKIELQCGCNSGLSLHYGSAGGMSVILFNEVMHQSENEMRNRTFLLSYQCVSFECLFLCWLGQFLEPFYSDAKHFPYVIPLGLTSLLRFHAEHTVDRIV